MWFWLALFPVKHPPRGKELQDCGILEAKTKVGETSGLTRHFIRLHIKRSSQIVCVHLTCHLTQITKYFAHVLLVLVMQKHITQPNRRYWLSSSLFHQMTGLVHTFVDAYGYSEKQSWKLMTDLSSLPRLFFRENNIKCLKLMRLCVQVKAQLFLCCCFL